MFNISILLQDLWCHNHHCQTAYGCWKGWELRSCWPPENYDGCHANKGCFPSSVKVRLEDGKSVAMSDLQIGDRVQTGLQ